mgnify:FL=1
MTFEMLDAVLGDHAPFLLSLSDGLQEELRLVIAGAKVGEEGSKIPEFDEMDETTKDALHTVLAKTQPIEADEERLYEICFHDYILYQIRNESFASCDPEAVGHGRYLIVFEKSEALSHLQVVTDAQVFDDGSRYPGTWTHFGIYTQNHTIDVIAQDLPEISATKTGL